MRDSTEPIVADGDMPVQCRLHTKCAPSPTLLLRKLEELAGKGKYRIEMRHNIYNITLNGDVDKALVINTLRL